MVINYGMTFFVLAPTLNFNVTIVQISSKPKLCKFSLNFSFMNFYLDFHFMCLCFFLMIPNATSCEQLSTKQNAYLSLYDLVTLVIGFQVVGIFYHSHHCYNALHVRLMVLMQNFPLLGFLKVLYHLGLTSLIPAWTLMLTMTLIANHFMGKVHHYNSLVSSASLTNLSKEFVHLML